MQPTDPAILILISASSVQGLARLLRIRIAYSCNRPLYFRVPNLLLCAYNVHSWHSTNREEMQLFHPSWRP